MVSHVEDTPASPLQYGTLDRVRRATAEHVNEQIDLQTEANIRRYMNAGDATILERIRELDHEWDIERVLETNASALALTGLTLGLTVSKRFLIMPVLAMSFLMLHGMRGWCPPIAMLRRLGVRTRNEIDQERYRLRTLLGSPGQPPRDYRM